MGEAPLPFQQQKQHSNTVMASPFTPDLRGLVRACPKCGQLNRLTYERLGNLFRCQNCKTELPAPADPVEAPSDAVFAAITEHAALPVLVDFWAPWCGPCRMIAPEVVKVAQMGAGQWLVVKVNTQDLPSLAEQHGISGIPTLAVFVKGREVTRQSGAIGAPAMVQLIQNGLAHV